MVTNTIRLTLKTKLTNLREADSKSFPHNCLEVFTKDSQTLQLPPPPLLPSSAIPLQHYPAHYRSVQAVTGVSWQDIPLTLLLFLLVLS